MILDPNRGITLLQYFKILNLYRVCQIKEMMQITRVKSRAPKHVLDRNVPIKRVSFIGNVKLIWDLCMHRFIILPAKKALLDFVWLANFVGRVNAESH